MPCLQGTWIDEMESNVSYSSLKGLYRGLDGGFLQGLLRGILGVQTIAQIVGSIFFPLSLYCPSFF